MAVIQSLGSLQALAGPAPVWDTHTAVQMPDGSYSDYAKIYRTQPNVRTVIDFLSRNIAQLGLHLFMRNDDNDRERVTFHEATEVLHRPNTATTRYRHIEHTVQDLGIYFNAYWLKVRPRTGRLALVRIPPAFMQVEGGLIPARYVMTINGIETKLDPSEVVHFRGYDPSNPLAGLSPMETLRRILAEESAASEHRQGYWRNAAQIPGVIERPKEAGKWSKEQIGEFQELWAAKYAGGKNAGKTPVLQDGMTFKPAAFSANDSQYIESRKLAMEICASAYHIPLPMVGILDHATFSNIREQHKHLYQDCLGPWLVMIEEDLELQLLPEFDGTERMYFEFNIAEKLKGSFEEQSAAIRSLTGGKQIMTQNEGRARLNLPKMDTDEADELSTEMQGAASDGGRPEDPDATKQPPRADAFSVVLRSMFSRQQQRLAKVAPQDRAAAFDGRRWTSELADDLQGLYAVEGADDAETLAWKVAAAVTAETQMLLTKGKDCFTAARADQLAERIAAGVV